MIYAELYITPEVHMYLYIITTFLLDYPFSPWGEGIPKKPHCRQKVLGHSLLTSQMQRLKTITSSTGVNVPQIQFSYQAAYYRTAAQGVSLMHN